MNHAEILDKIRKLLRLSQSANVHEAELALNHAMRLANQHNVDVAALDLDPEIERIIHERFPAGERLSYITKLALGVVTNFFHVEVVVARPEVIFVGTTTNVAIARYVQGYLTGAAMLALKSFERGKRRRPALSTRQNYLAGFFWGVRQSLGKTRDAAAIEDSRFALVLATQQRQREQYMDTLAPNTKAIVERKRRNNRTAAYQGFLRGRDTIIRTPLEGGKTTLLLQ